MHPVENKILPYVKEEFVSFNILPNKKIRIDSYEISERGILFTLKSQIGEYFEFTCLFGKINEFLSNFKTQIPITMETQSSLPPTTNSNSIHDIRNALFKALDGLIDGRMDVPTAKAVADVSQVLLNSAKIEIQYRKELGNSEKSKVKMLENVG